MQPIAEFKKMSHLPPAYLPNLCYTEYIYNTTTGRTVCALLFGNLSFERVLAGAIVLFTAMPVHECAHGLVADRLGDDTARLQGRLTLNPFVHLDPIGSVMLIFAGFGWAKPVQVNTRRFGNPKRDMALTALAGPVSNLLMALAVMILFKLTLIFEFPYSLLRGNSYVVMQLILQVLYINLYLALFNLLPFPPLDGFKIFGGLLPSKYYWTVLQYEQYIAYVLFFLIIFTDILSTPLIAGADALFRLLNLITRPLDWLM